MNRRGFTIVELVLVIAIIAILLSLGTIYFSKWQRKASIEREVKEFYSDLMYTRQQAMVTGMRHRIQFVSAKSITLLRYSSEGDATGKQIKQKNLPYSMSRSNWADPSNDVIDFNSRGMMTDPVQKAICVYSDAGPVPDSIVILQSRISLGRIIDQGVTNCVISNITLQ